MKRSASEAEDSAAGRGAVLGAAARKARLDDGSNAALELDIDSEDDVTEGEWEGEEEDAPETRDAAAGGSGLDSDQVLQEQLIRRRLGRMRELQSLYRDQYWRMLETLRRRHYRYALRNGHGGRKEEAAAEMAEQAKEGVSSKCACEDCDERPVPLSGWCFAHILMDPKQQLYARAEGDGDDDDPALWTEDKAEEKA